MLDTVVVLTVFGVVRDFDGASAPHLCMSSVGQMLPTVAVEPLSPCPCDQWDAVERDWGGGFRTTHFGLVAGLPT